MHKVYFAFAGTTLAALIAAFVIGSDAAGPAFVLFLIEVIIGSLQYAVDTNNLEASESMVRIGVKKYKVAPITANIVDQVVKNLYTN